MATAAQTLNTKQVQALAGVSHMAIYHWRQGTSTRDPLPTVEGRTPRSVAFKPKDLKVWAKKYGVELKVDPAAVAAGTIKLEMPAEAATKTAKAAKATKPVKAVKATKPVKAVKVATKSTVKAKKATGR